MKLIIQIAAISSMINLTDQILLNFRAIKLNYLGAAPIVFIISMSQPNAVIARRVAHPVKYSLTNVNHVMLHSMTFMDTTVFLIFALMILLVH